MAFDIQIATKDDLSSIEAQILRLQSKKKDNSFVARVATDTSSNFFKDIWVALALASGIEQGARPEVVAWGLKNWSQFENEDGFALSYPSLIALQKGAKVVSDSGKIELDGALVKRKITELSGVIGTGARQRTIVELDPDLPTAARLTRGARQRDVFFEFVRAVLSQLEIGALARKSTFVDEQERAAKGTILEFLYELHSNAFEHGRAELNARFLRLQKHQYPHRDSARRHALFFDELTNYIDTQPERPSNRVFNMVEASVSDFGPGILDGFLATFAGARYRERPRRQLLDTLLHEQLSSKSSDPNAGLGISQALAAARDLDAFVSLRTGEFWLTMQGRTGDGARLTFRSGEFPRIIGTHWQLLLPDLTQSRSIGSARV